MATKSGEYTTLEARNRAARRGARWVRNVGGLYKKPPTHIAEKIAVSRAMDLIDD